MTTMRTQLHEMWAGVAPAWGEHAAYVDARAEALTVRMLERTAPRPGERVLELACGVGGVAFAAAPLVAPDGEVVQSDVAAEMAEIAAARAGALGLQNVRTRVLDLEAIAEPDATYDVVVCREGLMFAVDPSGAAGEMRRVLRPDGRAAVSVWGPRSRNPWLSIVLEMVGTELGLDVPPPGIPGPFSLDGADALADVLGDGGLRGVAIEEVAVPLRAPSFDEWWQRTSALAGPLARMLASLPDDVATAVRARAEDAVQPYRSGRALDFPGVALLATGHR